MDHALTYFDNAATTFPKPQSVLMATMGCMEQDCGNPGRSSHILAMRASEAVYDAREKVAGLFGASPENVVFTLNTTYALNMAIKGGMSRGGHMLISNMEHNSVLRPTEKLKADKRIHYDIYTAYAPGGSLSPKAICDNILKKLRPDTRLVTAIHTSNICSHSLPIREIGALCHRHGILFLVDAAQSAGHLPINMKEDNIDLLCLPGHKGLYGPQGCGILILREGLQLDTLLEGGNGYNSLEKQMGLLSPERYEAGTLCTPALAGLSAGIDFINAMGYERIMTHERSLWQTAREGLDRIPGICVHDETPGSVLLFSLAELSADRLGALLSEEGFCLRTGYHCSSLAHRALKTPAGGAVRMSFGLFNTREEVTALCTALSGIADNGKVLSGSF